MVGKFAMGHRWPHNGSGGLAGIATPLQQRTIVISQDLGVEEYFNAMVGQVPEQLLAPPPSSRHPWGADPYGPLPNSGDRRERMGGS